MVRERYIDIAKGLSILCIVLLHYESGVLPHYINTFIGSFMISVFYVTSGWIMAQQPMSRETKTLLKKRWKQLGIPYLWWTIIILFFDILLCLLTYYDFTFILKEIYKTLTLRGIGTLWFLPALMGGELIWNWLKNKNKIVIILIFVLTIVYWWGYGIFFEERTSTIYRILDAPFRTICNISHAWIAIAAGYYFYLYLKPIINSSLKTIRLLVGMFFCVLSYLSANFLHVPSFLNFDIVWSLLAPLLGPLGILFISMVIAKWKICSFFDYWGRNSLSLMVTHYSIILVLCQIVVEEILGLPFYGWITLLCFFISLPIQYVITKFINSHANFLLGK